MRRFRFSIRALAIAVAMIAIGLALLVRYEPFQQSVLDKRLKLAGVLAVGTPMRNPLDKFISKDHVKIDVNGNTSLDDVRALLPRPKVISLSVGGRSIPAGWLESLRRFDNVWSVAFYEASVSDDEIAVLSGMPAIEVLTLQGSNIGDASIPIFKSMPALRRLSLRGTQVTDAGVEELLAAGIVVHTPNGDVRQPENPQTSNRRQFD